MRTNAQTKMIPAIKRDINRLYRRNILSGKDIIVFGCSVCAIHVQKTLEAKGLRIYAFVDNNSQKVGTYFLDTKVYSPELLQQKNDRIIILICNAAHKSIQTQLENIGYLLNQHFFIVGFKNSSVKHYVRKLIKRISFIRFFTCALKLFVAYRYYSILRKKYGKETVIFVTPYGASGEVYISGLYFFRYLEQNNIDKYIFIVPGKLAQNTARIFQIDNVILVNKKRIQQLLFVARFFGFNASKVKPLIYGATLVTNGIPSNAKCELRHTFLDAYKYDVYNLPADILPDIPCFIYNTPLIEQLSIVNSLIKGKTVILAPYVGTFDPGIPKRFWEELADKLLQKGHNVCTNSAGDHEPAIPGTKAIFFELIYAVPVVEYAGFFIGQRSGLCDIISSAKCNMTVIYESGIRTNRPDYFGLKNMGLRDTVNEVVYDTINYKDVIEAVLSGIDTVKERSNKNEI